jgi:hypothetical protein
MKKTFSMIGTLAIILGFITVSFAQMGSDNYSIPTSVLSSGGTPMTSASYQTDATLGQSSPVTDSSSANYGLSPGFWYTVEIEAAEVCECDLNGDGSCNILDWPYFIEDWGSTNCNDPGVDCECDLNGDGSCNILDWPYFIEDWGRTDCPIP